MRDGIEIARGLQVHKARKAMGLSQNAAARLAGISQPNLSAIENGARQCTDKFVDEFRRRIEYRPSKALERFASQAVQCLVGRPFSNLGVFGSVAQGQDGPDSDLDLVVDFEQTATLRDQADLVAVLQSIFGVHVDLVGYRTLRILGKKAPIESLLVAA